MERTDKLREMYHILAGRADGGGAAQRSMSRRWHPLVRIATPRALRIIHCAMSS